MRVASLRERQDPNIKLLPNKHGLVQTVSSPDESCTRCRKAALSFYLERTLLSRGFFPPFVEKITCFVNFDNLIGQLLCLPQYHL